MTRLGLSGKRLDINVYTEGDKLGRVWRLPTNLPDAVHAFKGSTVIRDGLGKPFVESYVKLELREWRSYAAHITQWERDHTLDC